MSGGFTSPPSPFGGGCVIGPGENPLRPGEIAIRVDICMECGKKMPIGLPTTYGMEMFDITSGEKRLEWGALCSAHEDMATHEWPIGGKPRRL